MLRLRRRLRLDESSDAGISLAEMVVSLMIATLVFMALAGALIGSSRSTLVARANQQSADALTEAIERVRSYDYAGLSMVSSDPDLASDTRIVNNGGNKWFDPSGGGTACCGAPWEQVVVGAVGSIPRYKETYVRNRIDFTVWTYVTQPTDSYGAEYRRVTVVTKWEIGGFSRERRDQTLMTNTRRGLPLPVFRIGSPSSVTGSQAGYVAIPISVTNLGARDAFNLSVSPTGSWLWYLDNEPVGGNSLWESTETTQTGDSNNDGQPDTGLMETGETRRFILYRNIALTEAAVVNSPVVITGRSIAQPDANSASVSVVSYLSIIAQTCGTGCNYRRFYLHNAGSVGNTNYASATNTPTLDVPMQMNKTAPVVTNIPDIDFEHDLNQMSTDRGNSRGRYLGSGGDRTLNNNQSQSLIAVWSHRYTDANSTYNGVARYIFWVRADTGLATNPVIIQIGYGRTGSDRNFIRANGTPNTGLLSGEAKCEKTSSPPGFQVNEWTQCSGEINISNLTLNKQNEQLLVRILKPNVTGTGNVAVRLGYDTPTWFPAAVELPCTAGCPP